jgi:hypothetical protein
MRIAVRNVLGLGILAMMLAVAALGSAQESAKTEEGFTSLFNGKDLSGWKYMPMQKESLEGKTETPDGRFTVQDGVIVAQEKDKGGKGGIKDLYTLKSFDKDFICRLEFRAAPKADSGVYIRGPQLQVRDYPTVGPYKPKSFKKGEWNDLEIIVKGNVLTTTVNGKSLSDKDTLDLTVQAGKPAAKLNGKDIEISAVQLSYGAVAECKCNGEVLEKAFKIPSKGGIGLQAESGKFEFRNIRVKEMK